MITGQAVKNTVMDLAPSARSTRNNGIKSSLVKGKETVSFDSLLSNKATSETSSSQQSDKSIRETKKTAVSTSSKEASNDNTPVKESGSSAKEVKEETANTQETGKAQETKESQAVKTSEADDNKLNAIAKTAQEVKELVLDTLNISEEELASLMETLGLTMVDLLNPVALKQITLANSGSNDFMSLLTDEGLSKQLTNLLDQVQEVLDKNGITQQDLTNLVSDESEFNKLMDKIAANSKESILTDGSKENAPTDEVANMEPRNLSNNSLNNVEDTTDTDSSIEFTVERHTSENSTSSQSNSDKDQSQNKESGFTKTELSNQFLDQMVNATKTTQAQFSQQVQHLSEIREIANQVIDQIKLVIKPEQTSMEFTLNPEHLGKVALNITSKEGMITATFTTQTQVAKEALESQLQIFKENLNNQGLKVDAIEVNVSSFNFEGSTQMDQSNSSQQEAAKGKKTAFRMDTDDSDFMDEALAGLTQGDLADYGNNVDYIA